MKASKGSEKLGRLQSASRNVNGATARVVASTNAGRRQLDDASESMADIAATVTQTQVKRKEMDSQVCFRNNAHNRRTLIKMVFFVT